MTVLKITLTFIIIGILYLSLTPTETLTVGNDKISHFIAYSCLMLNIGILVYPNKRKIFTGVVLAVFLGVIIEILQHYIPGRFMSLGDVIANTLGALLGMILILLFGKTFRKYFVNK